MNLCALAECEPYGKCANGVCQCVGDYGGSNCDTPECSDVACMNQGVVNTTTCSECTCPLEWTGTLCDNCQLEALCLHGSTVEGDCERCACDYTNAAEDLFTGPFCNTPFIRITMKFKDIATANELVQ